VLPISNSDWISTRWHAPLGHLLFWGTVLGFFVLYFGREAESYTQSLLFVALLLPVAMATTYFLTGVLVPRYLLPGRYGCFALYAVYTLIVSVYLELVVLVVSFIFLADYQVSAMNPATLDVFGLVVGLYVVVFIAMAADLARRWHRLRAAHAETELARLEAELNLRDAELARLRMQMHPHFLFNTLNNLYGLTLERSDDAPDVVLRIADLLDYMLYRCDRPLVPLAGEVEHLKTYLDLERLRYDDRVDVTFDVDAPAADAHVAPLLLVPFIENSFKHSASQTAARAWIRIALRTADEELRLTVANSKPDAPPDIKVGDGVARDATAGIGLANVGRRLDLLYPDAHDLTIRETPTQFIVHLRLPLHDSTTSLRALTAS
jgi:sensor histidine kinase YesM